MVDGAVDKLGSAVGLSDGVIVGIVVVGTGVGFDELMRVIFICKGFNTIMLWLNEQINIPCMFSMTLTLAVGSLVGFGVGSDVDVMPQIAGQICIFFTYSPDIQSYAFDTLANTPGKMLVAQPTPHEVTPTSVSCDDVEPGMIRGPPSVCRL